MVEGISIIICTYNGSPRISKALEAISKLRIPTGIPVEILVVDNNSQDSTKIISESAWRSFGNPFNLRIVDERNQGLSYARKTGAVKARYEYIIFCDDDNHLFPHYLEIVSNEFRSNSNLGILGGNGVPKFLGKKPSDFHEYKSSFAVGTQCNEIKDPVRKIEVYGAGMSLRRSVFLRIISENALLTSDRSGGKLLSGGDYELCYLFKLNGYDIKCNEGLKFYHEFDNNRFDQSYLKRLAIGIGYSSTLLSPYFYLIRKDFSVRSRKFVWLRDLLFLCKEFLVEKRKQKRNFYLGRILAMFDLGSQYKTRIDNIIDRYSSFSR